MFKRWYMQGIAIPELIRLKRRHGFNRVMLHMRQHGGRLPVSLVHDMVGRPDFVNRSAGKVVEAAWLTEFIWNDGRYFHDHGIAMERLNDHYHRSAQIG